MNIYDIWLQDGHIMMTVEARSNQEARATFNRMVSVKKRDAVSVKDEVKE